MTERHVHKSSVMIALRLLVLMVLVLAIPIGHRLGVRSTSIKNCAPCKEHICTLLSSLLGMLALMLKHITISGRMLASVCARVRND